MHHAVMHGVLRADEMRVPAHLSFGLVGRSCDDGGSERNGSEGGGEGQVMVDDDGGDGRPRGTKRGRGVHYNERARLCDVAS